MTKAKAGAPKPTKEKVAPATEEKSTTMDDPLLPLKITPPVEDTPPPADNPPAPEPPKDKAPEVPEEKKAKSKAKKHGDVPEVGDKVLFVSPIGAVDATVTAVLNDLTVNLEHKLGPQNVVQYGKQVGEWYW